MALRLKEVTNIIVRAYQAKSNLLMLGRVGADDDVGGFFEAKCHDNHLSREGTAGKERIVQQVTQ